MSESKIVIPRSEYRFLGPTGLRVSSISLGAWINYGEGSANDDARVLSIFDAAYKAGVNFFDTAEGYRAGAAETSMGKIIKELKWKREDYVLSTKIFFGTATGVNDKGLSRKHLIEGMNASLKRLQLDYVDIVFAHRPDRFTPMEEVVRGFNQIIQEGKAFYWGTSMWTSYEIEKAQHIATKFGLIGPVVEQPIYNLIDREFFEKELGPVLEDYNYGTTVFSPLAQGVLTGKYNQEVPTDSRFSEATIKTNSDIARMKASIIESEKGAANLAKVGELVKLAKELDTTTSNLALAWLLKQPHVSTAIIGATKVEQIEENLKTYELLPKITPEVLEKIEKIFGNKIPARDTYGLGN